MGVAAVGGGSGAFSRGFSSPPSFQIASPPRRSNIKSIAMMNGRLLDFGGGGVVVVIRTVDVAESQ
jgi:hypothetical protein